MAAVNRVQKQHYLHSGVSVLVVRFAPHPSAKNFASLHLSLRPAMPLRMPENLAPGHKLETGWSVLDYEIAQQKAQTLGNLGSQVEHALTRLRSFDAGSCGSDTGAYGLQREDRRAALLDEAAERVWAFMIQRELCGLRYWDAVVRDYAIPREVLNRVGQVRSKRE